MHTVGQTIVAPGPGQFTYLLVCHHTACTQALYSGTSGYDGGSALAARRFDRESWEVDAIALRLWNLAGIDAIWDDGHVMARTAFQLRMTRTGWF
jgi:hypothetical protein